MKKIIVTGLLACVGFLYAQAEEISEVYFNPSPKGGYDVLRVGRKLQSKGGLDAASVNINGTVDAAAGGTVDGTYAYKFGTAGSGGVMGIDGQDGKINMPAANFQVTDMAVKGGEAVFAATGFSAVTGVSAASTIGTLGNNVNQTGILEADGDLSAVTGEDLDVVITGETVENLDMRGMCLGENCFPTPKQCESGASLIWANREANDGITYSVLALKGTCTFSDGATTSGEDVCPAYLSVTYSGNSWTTGTKPSECTENRKTYARLNGGEWVSLSSVGLVPNSTSVYFNNSAALGRIRTALINTFSSCSCVYDCSDPASPGSRAAWLSCGGSTRNFEVTMCGYSNTSPYQYKRFSVGCYDLDPNAE